MFMGEQRILTVFIISIALGTETKLQIISIQLCTSADCTLMSGNGSIGILMFRRVPLMHSLLIIPFPLLILIRISLQIPAADKIHDKIQHGHYHHNLIDPSAADKIQYENDCIENAQPLHLNWYQKIQHNLCIRIGCSECKDNGQIYILSSKQ